MSSSDRVTTALAAQKAAKEAADIAAALAAQRQRALEAAKIAKKLN